MGKGKTQGQGGKGAPPPARDSGRGPLTRWDRLRRLPWSLIVLPCLCPAKKQSLAPPLATPQDEGNIKEKEELVVSEEDLLER